MSMNKKRLMAERRRDPNPTLLLWVHPGGLVMNVRESEYWDWWYRGGGFGVIPFRVASSASPRLKRSV